MPSGGSTEPVVPIGAVLASFDARQFLMSPETTIAGGMRESWHRSRDARLNYLASRRVTGVSRTRGTRRIQEVTGGHEEDPARVLEEPCGQLRTREDTASRRLGTVRPRVQIPGPRPCHVSRHPGQFFQLGRLASAGGEANAYPRPAGSAQFKTVRSLSAGRTEGRRAGLEIRFLQYLEKCPLCPELAHRAPDHFLNSNSGSRT